MPDGTGGKSGPYIRRPELGTLRPFPSGAWLPHPPSVELDPRLTYPDRQSSAQQVGPRRALMRRWASFTITSGWRQRWRE